MSLTINLHTYTAVYMLLYNYNYVRNYSIKTKWIFDNFQLSISGVDVCYNSGGSGGNK